jgi:hypothetical protein
VPAEAEERPPQEATEPELGDVDDQPAERMLSADRTLSAQ